MILFLASYYVVVVVLVAMKTKADLTPFEHECQRPNCKHRWKSLMARPVVCPRCKSYSWDEKPRGKSSKENG